MQGYLVPVPSLPPGTRSMSGILERGIGRDVRAASHSRKKEAQVVGADRQARRRRRPLRPHLLLKARAECEVDHIGLRLCRAKWLPRGGPMETERKCHEKKKRR